MIITIGNSHTTVYIIFVSEYYFYEVQITHVYLTTSTNHSCNYRHNHNSTLNNAFWEIVQFAYLRVNQGFPHFATSLIILT